jgi:hypothetical protein
VLRSADSSYRFVVVNFFFFEVLLRGNPSNSGWASDPEAAFRAKVSCFQLFSRPASSREPIGSNGLGAVNAEAEEIRSSPGNER